MRIEVTQRRSNACTMTKMRNCIQPIEYYMVRLKVDAVEEVEEALAEVEDVVDQELEQAKTDLITADTAYNAATTAGRSPATRTCSRGGPS